MGSGRTLVATRVRVNPSFPDSGISEAARAGSRPSQLSVKVLMVLKQLAKIIRDHWGRVENGVSRVGDVVFER
jgi:hypothetical protein